jgi:hypothetical protein
MFFRNSWGHHVSPWLAPLRGWPPTVGGAGASGKRRGVIAALPGFRYLDRNAVILRP